MTDFMRRLRHQKTDYIIRSLMDVDFYKFTMSYFIHKFYPGTDVTFKLINRDATIPLAKIIPEEALREQLDHVRTLMFRRTDLYYLRGMDVYGKNMFSEDYLTFLSELKLTDYDLRKNGDQYELTFKGPWEVVTFWETIALAIISELYYRELMKGMSETELSIMYGKATDKLYDKLKLIATTDAKIADFGQRRRHSFMWQKHAIEMAQEVLGDNFTGTSNTWLAFNQDLIPVGTNAHELFATIVALEKDDTKKRMAQYDIIHKWGDLYNTGLRVFLPDTFGTDSFLKNMTPDLEHEISHNWKGMRQDSGDPGEEAYTYIKFLNKNGISPKEKLIIFSDGLDCDNIIHLHNTFRGKIQTAFGWGTKFTNDFGGCVPNENPLFRPFSMVCKVTEVEGEKAIKLSNNPNKATGDSETIEKYIKIFEVKDQIKSDVEV